MANFNASVINSGLAVPPQKIRVDQMQGRIRTFESLYSAPASGTTPAAADKIIWGRLPIGAVLLMHLARVDFNTGTATSTMGLGDSTLAARHLVGTTAISATGSAVPSAQAFIKTGVADVASGFFVMTNVKGMGAFTVGDLVTGTGIPAASYVSAIDLANRSVTFTNLAATPASATNAAVTVTSTGHNYRVSDNSANADNLYVSTTDDATMMSTIATAQVANNQQIRVQVPFVLD